MVCKICKSFVSVEKVRCCWTCLVHGYSLLSFDSNDGFRMFKKCQICEEEETAFSCMIELCSKCISSQNQAYKKWLSSKGVESIWEINTE
jgi:hypothetical protein